MGIEQTQSQPIEVIVAEDFRDGAEALAWCGRRIARDLLEQAGLPGVPTTNDAA
jgi:hypothetical protein